MCRCVHACAFECVRAYAHVHMHARTDARVDVTTEEMHTHTDNLMRKKKVTGGDRQSRSKSVEPRFIAFGAQRAPKRTHPLSPTRPHAHTPTRPQRPHAQLAQHSASALTFMIVVGDTLCAGERVICLHTHTHICTHTHTHTLIHTHTHTQNDLRI